MTTPIDINSEKTGNDVAVASLKLVGRLADDVRRERAVRPAPAPQAIRRKEFTDEVTLPGLALEDYTKRTTTEEGTHVHVIQHKEWLEKIKQPPTAEELTLEAARRKKENRTVVGILVGIGLLAVGVIAYDSRARQKNAQSQD